MRILYVNHTVRRSGASISLSALTRHLPKDFEKFFLVPARSTINAELGALRQNTFSERFLCQFPVTKYNPPYPPQLYAWHIAKMAIAAFRIRKLVQQWGIDLVHANETTLVAYAFAARLAGVPTVLHARTSTAPRAFERSLLSRFGRSQAARIVCIDHEVRESLPASAKAIAETISDPIDLGPPPVESDVQALRSSWGCEPAHIVIGQVASLHTQKGIWLILDLAEKLCAEFAMVRFVLIGEDVSDRAEGGGEGAQLRSAIAARGLQGKVMLPGYSDELGIVYAALDIGLCLFGQHLGGVGRPAYETILARKPLVALLPNPESSKTLQPRKSGLIYSPDDPNGLWEGLRSLISSPELRTQLAASGHLTIGNCHDPNVVASSVSKLYHSLVTSDDLVNGMQLKAHSLW